MSIEAVERLVVRTSTGGPVQCLSRDVERFR